jgi:hypothetical protein
LETRFSSDIGKTNSLVLTNDEAEYANAELTRQHKNVDFHEKKVAFVLTIQIAKPLRVGSWQKRSSA